MNNVRKRRSLSMAGGQAYCWAMLVLLSATVGEGTYGCPAETSENNVREALAKEVDFPKAAEKAMAIDGRGRNEMEWDDIGRYFHGVRMYVFVKDFTNQSYGMISVLPDCSTVVSDGVRGLSALMRALPPSVDEKEYETFAKLLVKLINVNAVYGDGYRDGVGMISSANDIAFKSPGEEEELRRLVTVAPPRLSIREGGFSYDFFSWLKRTSLSVVHGSLVWHTDGSVSYEARVVAHRVGTSAHPDTR